MRIILLLVAFLGSTATLRAQSFEELEAHAPRFWHELYRAYPALEVSDTAPAPKGYRPFYIWHCSRHGSRWNGYDWLYEGAVEKLIEAEQRDELTPLGKRFLRDWRGVCQDAKARLSELNPQGEEEHRFIAEVMCRNYAEVFSKKNGECRLEATATTTQRCQMSMACFVQEFTRHFPHARIGMHASQRDSLIKRDGGLEGLPIERRKLADEECYRRMPSAQSVISRIFTPQSRVAASIENGKQFVFRLFNATAIMGSTPWAAPEDIPLYLFTREELAGLYTAANVRRYIHIGPYPENLPLMRARVRNLLEDVISCADQAICELPVRAHLRFGHDSNIVPLAFALGVEQACYSSHNLEQLYRHWSITRVAPMASNLQLVFYRSKHGPILVKVLFQQRPSKLDIAAEPLDGYFYKWDDIKSHIKKQLQ